MSTPAAAALLVGLLAFAACLFIAMLFVFARVTGWTTLARRFPAARDDAGRRYAVDGVILGEWGWAAPPLRASVSDAGLILRAMPPFGVAFRPVRLPWRAIRIAHRDYALFRATIVRYGSSADAQIGFAPSPLAVVLESRKGAQGPSRSEPQ